ncbi:MAG TPA: hypothetical protein VFY18_07605 [Candidatus Limnocylindrales bacterium]|nr:hypothetical protein [Candidatus Limnocylindrales bacterium]
MQTSRPMNPLRVLAIVAVAALAGACASSGKASEPTRPAATTSSATPAPTAGSADVTASDLPNALVLVGRTGSADLELVVVQTGESVMKLPAGVMDPRWQWLVTAKADTLGTIVRDVAAENGSSGPVLDVKGRWRLPTIGTDRVPAGVSADGSTFALVAADAPGTGAANAASRFAVVQHVVGARPTRDRTAPLQLTKVIELPGSFEFDALSPDGSILYVVEHLDGQTGAYQVRAVDIATGKLRDGVIADKRNIGEAMAGWPVGQVRQPDGVVLTLYRSKDHPFVHVLNTVDAWAVCLDLPASAAGDTPAATDWGLAAGPDRRSIYAVNATLGIAAEIDATELVVERTAVLKTASVGASSGVAVGAPSIVLAKFGHDEVGAAGRVVVSPDGATVWAAGSNGIVAIASRDLKVTRRMLDGVAVDAIAVAPDGSAIYALERNAGRIVALDTATGSTLGEVPGRGFDRLLAAAPW